MNLLYKLKEFLSDLSIGNRQYLRRSKVFCMAPWVQLHAQTNGKVAPCCMASINNGNEIGDLNQDPALLNAWNSENMKQLRLDLLSGKQNTICNNCYAHEKLKRSSERHYYNRDFKHYFDRVKQTAADGSLNTTSIPVLDIRFSNKCNYKCRICNSEYSSLWYEEEKKLGKAVNPETKEIWVAADETKFWESFKTLLPTVKRLHFAGGEPLFMDEHYATLEYLVEIGNTDIHLTYNTNFSTLRYRKHNVTELWKKFRRVDIWASLDGMGEKGDYQRKGQKWNEIEENFRIVKQECNNVLFGINATVSIFNVMHMPDFYKYMVEQGYVAPERMNLYPLMYPHHFCINSLSPGLKQQVSKLYKDFEKGYLSGLKNSYNIKNHCRAIVTLMNASDENENMSEIFNEAIKSVDRLRGENFSIVFPELSTMLKEKATL